MLKNLEKTPWPWFGGKSDAAPAVWAALGDCSHYVEPFAGSLAACLGAIVADESQVSLGGVQ